MQPQVHLVLAGVRGLVAQHGAGLASIIFMRAGTTLAELDVENGFGRNMKQDRFMYQYIANETGILAPGKVWLNEATGHRICSLPYYGSCSMRSAGPYHTGNAYISPGTLADVLQATAAGTLAPAGIGAPPCPPTSPDAVWGPALTLEPW